MYKLKLKNALSYSGAVSANEKEPFVEVETKTEADELVANDYFDIVEFLEVKDDEKHTAASLKKLNADEQKAIIAELEGDLESVNNEDERIALILQLQEEQKEVKE